MSRAKPNYSLTNIYLDIDGVLLVNDKQAASHADQFLQYVLDKYPESTYWLTTHCWTGENRAIEVVSPTLKPETIDLLSRIKPTEWGDYKTDGIDFSKPFIWFDDDLYDEERETLMKHNTLSSHIEINLAKDENQLLKIIEALERQG
jgi:hypothetical protein